MLVSLDVGRPLAEVFEAVAAAQKNEASSCVNCAVSDVVKLLGTSSNSWNLRQCLRRRGNASKVPSPRSRGRANSGRSGALYRAGVEIDQ